MNDITVVVDNEVVATVSPVVVIGPGGGGTDAREIELRTNATHIQWRYEGVSTWTDLIALSALKGAPGDPGIGTPGDDGEDGKSVLLRVDSGYIQWQNVGDTGWTNLVSLSSISGTDGEDGNDGRDVTLRKNATHIQWSLDGTNWTDLVALADLKGAPGDPGNDGADAEQVSLQVAGGFIQWRRGEGTWSNLIATSVLKGDSGNDGADGLDGDDGKNVELQKTSTHIQWRWVGDTVWNNLVALSEIKGADGTGVRILGSFATVGELPASGAVGDAYLIDGNMHVWTGSEWNNVGTIQGPAGEDGLDGKEVEMGTSATHIQWRHVGESTWNNLYAIADLEGSDGVDGREVEFRVDSGYIQWKYANEISWINLVDLASLEGDPGTPGSNGTGIENVALISGDHTPGTTDVYRITLTNDETYDFSVYNGSNGLNGENATAEVFSAVRSRVYGHSYTYGNTTSTDPAIRNYSDMAQLIANGLGLPNNNLSVSGSSLGDAASTGDWADILQNEVRSTSPTPIRTVYTLMYGLNDAAQVGHELVDLVYFKSALETVVSRIRCGVVYEESHSSVVFGGTGWSTYTGTGRNSGASARYNNTSGGTVTVTPPSDFTGGTLVFGFPVWGDGSSCVWTTVVNGITYTLDTATVARTGNHPTVASLRIPNVRSNNGPIVLTVTSVSVSGSARAVFDWWGVENPEDSCPVVALVGQPKPLDYTSQSAAPAGPVTDAGVDNINTVINEVVDKFGDRVVYVNTSALDKNSAYWESGNVHPNAAGHLLIAQSVLNAISDVALVSGVNVSYDDLVDGTTNRAYTDTEKTKLAGLNSDNTHTADDIISGVLNPSRLPVATDSVIGAVELATNTEAIAGTDTTRALTPAGLNARTSTETRSGIVELATPTEVATGTDAIRVVTPATLKTQTDAAKNRANHTGSQTSASISDFVEAVQDVVGAMVSGASGVTVSYDDPSNSLVITGPGASGLDAEAVRDAIGIALVGIGNISIAVNDPADTITISTTATVNSTDAQLRDRSTHTGSQAISTVTNLQTTLDTKVASTTIDDIVTITQAAYDALGTKVATTLYIIVG